MKKIILGSLFVLAGLFLLAQAPNTAAAAGAGASFSKIIASNGMEIVLLQSNQYSVNVEASDAELKNAVNVEIKKTTLYIGTKKEGFNPFKGKEKWKNSKSGWVKVTINVINLESIEASGACTVTLQTPLKTNNLEVDLSGASKFEGELESNYLKLKLSGACSIDIKGSAHTVKANISGASSLRGSGFMINDLSIDVSGASNGTVNVKNTIEADVTGASNLKLLGTPSLKKISTSGASSIKTPDF